jgi:DNA-binding MarR family transcriptional regulator
MKQLQNENIDVDEIDECAAMILETVPLIMRVIRAERRELGGDIMPLPHFRVLAHLNRNPESSLSSLAEEIGLTLPSISKIVEALHEKGLVSRREAEQDRRYIRLSLTPEGMRTLQVARLETQCKLAKRLREASPEQRAFIKEGLRLLKDVFTQRKNNGVDSGGK